MNIIPIEELDYNIIKFTPLERRQGEKNKKTYAAELTAFDIETSYHPDIEQSVLYLWQFAIGETVVYGRYLSEYITFLHELKKRLNGLWLVSYVHNLSFEAHHLSGVYKFMDYEVFCTDSRKIIKCEMFKTFEYRCSAKLTNMSLDAFTHKFCKVYKKLTGTVDHKKERFPDEPIEEDVLKYGANDVLSLVEGVTNLMNRDNDNLYTIPLTSTGYVRREMKQAMSGYHLSLKDRHPDYKCYKLLRAAFRGGNTHANRYYSEYPVENVDSYDESSAYPAVQCNSLFPVGKFVERINHTSAYVDKQIERGFPFIMRCRFYHIKLKDIYTAVPYIPFAKCPHIEFPAREICNDNGRILKASRLDITITDVDYLIIATQYTFEKLEVLDIYTSAYDYLPEPLRNLNIEFFRRKTELKGVVGQELYYMKAKNLLNSIYGCSVQEEIKESILFDNCSYTPKFAKYTDEQREEEYKKLYEKHGNVLYTQYAYGVWTTANARRALQYAIDRCGDSLVYCDTDSVKFCGTVDFSEYNSDMMKKCLASGAYAVDPQGITHYMGVYEHDAFYKRFITLGAKRYAYEDESGLHTTISGVSKKSGALELAAHGGIEAFKRGFVFQNTGKLEAVYNDENLGFVTVKGHRLNVTRNIVLRETTYTLGETDDYMELIELSHEMLNKIHKAFLQLEP